MEELVAESVYHFFISKSNNPDLVLVSHPLTDNNYGSWFHAMIMTLLGRNKLNFVEGTILAP